MAEMCSASLQLRVGASVVLDRRTAGVRQARPSSDRRQGHVDVAAAADFRHHGRRWRRCRGRAGLGG